MPAASQLEIYCPRCHWKPNGRTHWTCSCGCVWNTFETAAVCSQCQRRWRNTDCPDNAGGCGRRSAHINWYHGLDELITEMLN
jgi:hypothetical protein